MHVEPITCLRPLPQHAAEFASLPYDVFTDAEARAYVKAHPTSFLTMDRPECNFEPGARPSEDELYGKAASLLRERQLDRTLIRDETPCLYLYELTSGDHRQTGVMAAVAVDDYLDGTVRRHELTLPDKEQDRVRHITAMRAQTGPVFLAYPDSPALDFILDAAKQSAPLYDFVSTDGVRQRVWRIARDVAVGAIQVTFGTIDRAYIADGHHRAAAAAAICTKRREEGREHDPADHFLAVLFPASQLRILPYDRIVSDTASLNQAALLDAMASTGFEVRNADAPVRPTTKGSFGMYAFGRWHELEWRGAANLDVAVLQNQVLGPLLAIDDPRTSKRLSFAGGIAAKGLEERAGANGIAFSLCPTSMDELMEVSDAGGIMPPKSTWFDPKLLSGLAIRRIW